MVQGPKKEKTLRVRVPPDILVFLGDAAIALRTNRSEVVRRILCRSLWETTFPKAKLKDFNDSAGKRIAKTLK